jgi:hypothetical protein
MGLQLCPPPPSDVAPQDGEPQLEPDRPRWGRVERITRIVLWTVLGLLVMREATEGLRVMQLRTRRALDSWWSDVDRRSRRDTRRAEIGLLATLIGRPPP